MRTSALLFKTGPKLARLIDDYFVYIKGTSHLEKKLSKTAKNETDSIKQKVWDREPEPATFSGLAFSLGFNSLKQFEEYEQNGKHAAILKRGRLRIEAIYETRLHQTPTGAMFALKSMGWNEKPEGEVLNEDNSKTLQIEIINSGPTPAGSEKEVII